MQDIRPNDIRDEKSGRDPTNVSAASMGSIFKDLVSGMRNLIRSEINLAKAEAKDTSRELTKRLSVAVVFGVVALLGILPFIAFMVLGLGKIFGDNYWLSALVVSIVMLVVGVGFAVLFLQRIKRQDLSLPTFRDSVRGERKSMEERLDEVSSATRRAS